jgi:hypothetical protein
MQTAQHINPLFDFGGLGRIGTTSFLGSSL